MVGCRHAWKNLNKNNKNLKHLHGFPIMNNEISGSKLEINKNFYLRVLRGLYILTIEVSLQLRVLSNEET